jgi:hypothetical protein
VAVADFADQSFFQKCRVKLFVREPATVISGHFVDGSKFQTVNPRRWRAGECCLIFSLRSQKTKDCNCKHATTITSDTKACPQL